MYSLGYVDNHTYTYCCIKQWNKQQHIMREKMLFTFNSAERNNLKRFFF